MTYSSYREFLMEEEKFMKQLERNIQDQLNRLKVEELSLLKLISSSDISNHELIEQVSPSSANLQTVSAETTKENDDEDDEDDDEDDLPLAEIGRKIRTPAKTNEEIITIKNNEHVALKDQMVNAMPLDFNVRPNVVDVNDVMKSKSVEKSRNDEEMEEEDEEDEESGMENGE